MDIFIFRLEGILICCRWVLCETIIQIGDDLDRSSKYRYFSRPDEKTDCHQRMKTTTTQHFQAIKGIYTLTTKKEVSNDKIPLTLVLQETLQFSWLARYFYGRVYKQFGTSLFTNLCNRAIFIQDFANLQTACPSKDLDIKQILEFLGSLTIECPTVFEGSSLSESSPITWRRQKNSDPQPHWLVEIYLEQFCRLPLKLFSIYKACF